MTTKLNKSFSELKREAKKIKEDLKEFYVIKDEILNKQIKILCVDDTFFVLKQYEKFADKYDNIFITCVDNYEKFAGQFYGNNFDVFIIDIVMPNCSGFDILKMLSINDPAIICSGNMKNYEKQLIKHMDEKGNLFCVDKNRFLRVDGLFYNVILATRGIGEIKKIREFEFKMCFV